MTKPLENVFADALGIESSRVTGSLEFNSTKEWDSVAHMALIAALEEAYGIMLDTDDVLSLSSVQRAREILGKYGVTLSG
jgi:acyl carrier protein